MEESNQLVRLVMARTESTVYAQRACARAGVSRQVSASTRAARAASAGHLAQIIHCAAPIIHRLKAVLCLNERNETRLKIAGSPQ